MLLKNTAKNGWRCPVSAQMHELGLLHAYMIGVVMQIVQMDEMHSLLHAQEIFSYAFSLKTLALLDTKLPNMRGWVTECELMHIRDTATQAHNGGFLPKRL